ncbi:MAG: type IV pilus assembly protein PilM [Actinomycetota bacterium]|jgi:type IV pilus assembly protein PilM|nr:type IV pilus assembly protein PilM [Actinomycetota bacterium]MDA8293671.1 type IV pilus assembly protein PilM [Actinomycetota bacterium]
MAQLIVGLDIGTSAVRAAELDTGPSRPVLVTYGQVGLPPGSVVDGEVRDRAAVTEAITRLWHNGQFSTSSVVVGIAGLRAITRELDLPYVPDDEVDSAVRFQSEEVIPFPPEQTVLSAQVLTDFTSPEGGKMRRVLVAAAHTDLVSGVISVVESAGLQVRGVDLVSSALVRAVSSGDGTDQPEAIVSIGAGLTVVAIHQQGRPQFVRTIGQGGNAVTAAISGSLDLPMADAEGLKRRLGEATPQVQAAAQAAQETMANLVGEVRNSIQYYASLPGRMPVARVLVTGGGSYLAGLLPLLESQVHLPVVPVSPLSRLDTSKLPLSAEQAAQVSAVLSTPIGLALPETNPAVKKFNLLPPEVAKRVRMKQLEQRVMVGSGVVVLALLAFGGWKFVQVHNAQNNVDNIQTSISSLNAQIPKYDLVVAADNAYNEGKARRATVLNSAVDWPAVLSGLIAITPPGAQVDSFNGTSTSATSGTGSTSATTAAGTPPASAAIGSVQLNVTGPGPNLAISQAWITKVGQSPLFANPVQGATTTTSSGQVAFPFSLSVTPTAGLAKNASVR